MKDHSTQQYAVLPSRFLLCMLIILLQLAGSGVLHAEGTREVAPTSTDSIVMLEINRVGFGEFAAFDGPEDSRLYFSIANPNEMVSIGLTAEYGENGRPLNNFGLSRYRFRIRKASDNSIVHGPFTVNNLNANVNSWSEAEYGQYDVTELQNGQLMYQFDPDEAGDYFIEFEDIQETGINQKILIGYWDITVTDNGEAIDGRLWSRNWAFRTPEVTGDFLPECGWDRQFVGTLYSYTTDGFVSKIDFSDSGFQGLSFTVAFNSQGPGDSGDLTLDRQSIPGENATLTSAEHQIFVNEPDINLFPNGECGQITTDNRFRCAEDGFCLQTSVNKPGQVEIYLDFNQNGVFDPNSEDVSLVYTFTEDDLSACIPWDGLKGDSTAVSFADTVDLIYNYTQGVQHWAVYDVEFLKNGFCIEAVRPTCNSSLVTNTLYWDDRQLTLAPGTGQPKDGRGGCLCRTDGCRTWNNFDPGVNSCSQTDDEFTQGYGDKSTLNTWWFANIRTVSRANIPVFSCQITGDSILCGGGDTEFAVEVSGFTNTFTYNWSGPDGFSSSSSSTGVISQPGEYCVTVTNDLGCETVCCQTLSNFDAPVLLAEGNDASCEAATDGSITATASGGAGGYQYSLDDGPFVGAGVFVDLSPGTYTVTVQDSEGCTSTAEVIIDAGIAIPVNYPDAIFICYGDSLQIPIIGDPTGFNFAWSPTTGLDNPTAATPVFFPTETTTYTVLITSGASSECSIEREVMVSVYDPIDLVVDGGGTTCDEEATLTANVPDGISVQWFNENGILLSEDLELVVTVSGEQDYTVVASDFKGCTAEETVTVMGGMVDVMLPDTIAACLGQQLNVNVTNLDPNDVLSYQWSPASAIASGANTATPDIIETLGESQLFVTITNQFGCEYTDTILLAVIDPNISLSFTSEVQCNGSTVEFTNTSQNAFGYIWDFGDGEISYETNPIHNYTAGGSYTVTLDIVFDVDCVTPSTANIMVAEPELIAGFTYDLAECSADSAKISFFDTTFNPANNTNSWLWTFGTLGTSTEQNPMLTVTESGVVEVTLTVTATNGCESSFTEMIDVQLIEDFNLTDTVVRCPDDVVVLNPDGNPAYIYNWSPAIGLDATDIASPTATPDVTTTYTVMVQNVIGSDTCFITDQVTVVVPDAINLDVGPGTIATCGEDVTITATADVDVNLVWISAVSGPLPIGNSVVVNPSESDTITVVATDNFGCTEIKEVIVINNGIDVSLTPNGTITACASIDTVLTINNLFPDDILDVVWSPAANIVSGQGSTEVSVSVTSGSVDFTAVVTNQHNCSDTLSVTIAVVPFEPVLPDTVYVCAGESTELNPGGNPNYTYSWTPDDGQLSATDVANPTFNGTNTTVYTVDVTDASNGILCEFTDQVTVIVQPDINLTSPSADTTLCAIAPVTLTVSTDIPIDINWYLAPDFNNSVGTGSFLTVTPEEGTSIYVAIADDGLACADSATVVVTVDLIEEEELPDTMITVCIDAPTPLNPGGNPDLVYVWEPTTNLDLSDPSNPIITTSEPQEFTVTISDPVAGCVLTRNVSVDVAPAISLEASGDTVLCTPAPVTLMATTDLPADLVWYLVPNLDDPIGSGSFLTVTPGEGTNTYQVFASSADSECSEIQSVVVMVGSIEEPELPDSLVMVCVDTPTPLNPGGNPALTYVWTPTTNLDLSDPSNPIVTTDEDITYTVTITDPEVGCELTMEVRVEVFPEINLMTAGDTVSCETAPLILTATADVPVDIDWFLQPNLDDIIGTGTNITVNPVAGVNTYLAVATDPASGCTESSTVVVDIKPIDPEELPDTLFTICANTPTPLNPGGNPNLTYTWEPTTNLDLTDPSNPIINAEESITYTVTVVDPIVGCEVLLEVVVEVFPPINLEASGDTSLCEMEAVTLTATSTADNITFDWYLDLNGAPFDSGSEITVAPVMGVTSYFVQATDANGCTEVDTVTVSILPVMADITPRQVLCEPTDAVTLGVTNLDPNQELTFAWSPANAVTPLDAAEVTVDPNVAQEFTVVVTNQFGCTDTLVTGVEISALPEDLSISADPDTILFMSSTVITVTGCDDCDYTWLPPNGTIDPETGPSITATPDETGEQVYEVVVSRNGCEEILSISIFVVDFLCDPDHLFLPNAFSPNGDNENDVIRLRSLGLDDIKEFELMIYNRWGEEVYRSTNQYGEWDGTYRDELLPPDVYGFWLRVVCPEQQEVIQRGNITLFR